MLKREKNNLGVKGDGHERTRRADRQIISGQPGQGEGYPTQWGTELNH
jgi:hypothetical protein